MLDCAPRYRKTPPSFSFTLSSDLHDIDIGWERRFSLFFSLNVCACKMKDLVLRLFSRPSAIFIEAFFAGIFFTFSFFARVCICGVDNIVSMYRSIYRLDKSVLIAVYVSHIDRCIATRKYSLQKYRTCHIAIDIFLTYIFVLATHKLHF